MLGTTRATTLKQQTLGGGNEELPVSGTTISQISSIFTITSNTPTPALGKSIATTLRTVPTSKTPTGECASLVDSDSGCNAWDVYCTHSTYRVWMKQNCANMCCRLEEKTECRTTTDDFTETGDKHERNQEKSVKHEEDSEGSKEKSEKSDIAVRKRDCNAKNDTSTACANFLAHCTSGTTYHDWMMINCQLSCCGVVSPDQNLLVQTMLLTNRGNLTNTPQSQP